MNSAVLPADLGVTRSHDRPHTSTDNPFSESHFKTLKYQPRFRKRFGCIEDHRFTFEAWSGLPHVTTCRIAQPPRAAFVTELRPTRLPDRLGSPCGWVVTASKMI
jgi:hypothetical protein